MSEEDKMMEELILSGALEVAGFDSDTQEITYNFTEKLKDVSPELHHEFNNYFHQEMMFLWEKGFLDIDFTQEEPKVSLTDKAFSEEDLSKLNPDRKYSLKEIIRILFQ